MQKFRILHISDLHLTSDVSTSTWDPNTFVGLDSYLSKLDREAIDCVILSGDVADTASERNLNGAKGILLGQNNSLNFKKAGMDKMNFFRHGIPICLMPGNHDRLYGWKNSKCGSKQFETTFGENWDIQKNLLKPSVAFQNPAGQYVKSYTLYGEEEDLTFVFADFNLKKPTDALPHFGKGMVYNERLACLTLETRHLTETASKPMAVVWVVHFPTHYYVPIELELVNAKQLEKAAISEGVDLIIAGHTHSPDLYGLNGMNPYEFPALIVGGSLSKGKKYSRKDGVFARNEPHCFYEIELAIQNGVFQHTTVSLIKWVKDPSSRDNFTFQLSKSDIKQISR